MNSKGVLFALAVACLQPVIAGADASGPDYFKVVGVAWDDVLNIRSRPTHKSAKIGEIPPNGGGVQNFGCIGRMSYVEWQAATPSQRKAAQKRVWCKIYYAGIKGWVAGRFLAEGTAP
ncbi:SH3 domain-containing protein [uncultured Sulfitobacter sp.]|uniref:SH3 domain-containing protein n=1 Tax=uncultured Sulfitobacter sp. TaxID=191468 RepID=UPI00345339A8